MTLEKTTIDLKEEYDIGAGMILSLFFTKGLLPFLTDMSLLKSPYIRIICGWIIEYYQIYKNTPKETIYDIFESKKSHLQKDVDGSVLLALDSIRDIYFSVAYNEEYYLNKSIAYLEKRRLEVLLQEVNGLLISNATKEAENKIFQYKKSSATQHHGLDVFGDERALQYLNEDDRGSLFSIPDAFGEMIGPLYRGDILNISGLTKRGKSWFLLYLTKLSYLQGLNTVYFTLEMDKKTVIPRVYRDLLGQTVYPTEEPIEFPFFNDENKIEMRWIEKDGLNLGDARRVQRLTNLQMGKGTFRLYDVTEVGCKISDMVRALEILEETEGIVADAVFIDYIDIAEKEKDMFGKSHEIYDEMWKYVKRNIAQRRNALVGTVSQLNKEGFGNDGDISSSAGAFSKTFHVSHWININQTEEEMRANIMRASIVARNASRRFGEVVILQCLDIGRPALDSRFRTEVSNYDEFVKNYGQNKL